MVQVFGMSDELGLTSLTENPTQNEWKFYRPFSENTLEKVEKEVKKIVDLQYDRAVKILTEKAQLLNRFRKFSLKFNLLLAPIVHYDCKLLPVSIVQYDCKFLPVSIVQYYCNFFQVL